MSSLEQEIDLNWQEYPEGMERFLTACKEGTILGDEPVGPNRDCGCAYGHISGLNKQKAQDLISKRRYQLASSSGFTPLEEEVFFLQPGDGLDRPIVRRLHDLILARKPV